MLRGTLIKKYGRGTKAKSITLQNQIDALRYQVSQQKPELQYFEDVLTYSATSTSIQSHTFNYTDIFVSGAQFDTSVTGDRWKSHWMKVNMHVPTSVEKLRVVIYTPYKVTNSFAPANTDQGFAQVPDPAAFKVHLDHYCDFEYAVEYYKRFFIKFNNQTTILNRDSSVVEKNPIKIFVMWENALSTGEVINMGTLYGFRNK